MTGALQGKSVAILVANGFEQVELFEPRKALQKAGAATHVVSPSEGKVKGWNHTKWGKEIPVDVPLDQAAAERFDALLLPGGVMNPDKLRTNPAARTFVKAFFDAGKPVAVICHGAWTLIDAGVVKGRRLTSYPSLARISHMRGRNGWTRKWSSTVNSCRAGDRTIYLPSFRR